MRELEKIATLENEFETQLLEEVLKERGIDAFFKHYHDMAYDGLYTNTLGWAGVYGVREDAAAICAALAEIRQSVL